MIHSKKGILTKKGRKLNFLTNKMEDVWVDKNGKRVKLDGTELTSDTIQKEKREDILTKRLVEKIEIAKGDKGEIGEKGEKGDSIKGEKGKDADEKLILGKVLSKIPIPKDGEDGYSPIKGVDYFDGKNGLDGKDGIGKDGKDGKSPSHKWDGTKLAFTKPDGKWGKLVELKGEKGLTGDGGGQSFNGQIKSSAGDYIPKYLKDKLVAGSNITITESGDKDKVLTIASSGSSTGAFTDLTDVPANYTGSAGKAAVVNGTEDGLVFTAISGTDEKVKYDASDTVAGYVADKVVAGTGISVAEGTGATENKLVITNTLDTLAELTEDATHRVVTDTEKSTWNGKADALTADQNYVSDAQLVVIGNTSGANTGDNVEVAAQAVGFTITKGTTPKVLTVALDANVAGTNTGDNAVNSNYSSLTQYTDELAQDAIGNAVGNGLDYDDTTGAIAVDETELVHNSLGSKQGGTVGEFYHLTSAQATVVGNTSGANTGDNATNTQYSGLAATIPDNLTDFVAQTAHRVFYSNNLGDVTELALGADGTFLKSNGATSAPTFAVPAGSGDVSKVGTPVNNQVGVWTGDGTLEGDTALTYDAATDTLTSVAFAGNLTGNVTGNTSGTSGSTTGNAATATAAASQVITDNAIATVDAADVADNDYAKFTANGLEGRSYAEVLSDIGAAAALTADQNYVSDAQLTVIVNTSGTNTGNQDLSGYELLSNKSTDTALGASDTLYPSQKAVKSYVDAIAQGLSVKQSVLLATAAALPTNTYLAGVITITATGTLTVDGTVTALNDRILVKDEVADLKNGVYKVTTAGAIGVAAVLTRSTDMDIAAEFPGAFVFVESGTVNTAAGFVCTNSAPPTVGTTSITFTQFSGAGEITAGAGLTKTANTLDAVGTANRIVVGVDAIDIGTDVVTLTGTQTLTNKTLTSPKINEDVAITATATELNYTDGVTSAIQTQLGTKAPSTAPTFATSVTGSYLTASEMLGTGASKEIVSLPVATYPSLTELTYVKGVTSALQTQLNAKAASLGADDNYVTDAEKVVIGNTSGTNSGNQTSIVGITGTIAQFNTAISDGDLATGGGTATGTNTGDNATNTQYSGLAASKQDVDADLTALAALASPADKLDLAPTDLKISTASKGGVFNGGFELAPAFTAVQTASNWIDGTAAGSATDDKYGWYFYEGASSNASAQFDNTVSVKGGVSIKSILIGAGAGLFCDITTNGSDFHINNNVNNKAIAVKANTTYRLRYYLKTSGAAANSIGHIIRIYTATGSAGTQLQPLIATPPTKFELIEHIFTTGATTININIGLYNGKTFGSSDGNAGQIAWFDDITLEEVVTDATFTGKIAEKIKGVLQAVTSTDNIDNSLDSAGAYANTYALTNAINEGATHIQTFTPTKKYTTQIAVWPIAKGTGNWTLVVHTAGNVVVASKTIANASVATGAMLYFDVPNIWTTGALHFHLYSSVADGTAKTNTSNDLEACSFIQRYAKKTETFSLIANGIKTELKADKDGLLSNSIIDLDNGKYLYVNPFNAVGNFNDIFSATAGGGSTIPDVISGWDWSNTLESLQSVGDTTARSVVFKVNTILPVKHLQLDVTMFNNNVLGGTFSISTDNVNYTTLKTLIQSASAQSEILETDLVNGLSVFYIKFAKSTENTYLRIDDLHIFADLDTSSIPQGLLYPIATNQFTETVKLPSVATRIYYRLNKFTNEFGVVVPALEFTDASAVNIGYVPLKIDNSQETNPAVAIVKASTTNGQASGTGSDEGLNYVLNDGEYMTLSTAVAELSVVYLVGKGTTAFTNITKNIFYLSSNGEGNDSTQDASHQGNFVIGASQQGLTDRIKDIGNEIQNIKNNILFPRFGEIFGNGTAYNLTTSLAVLSFGTSGNLELLLPDVGIYEITAEIHDDLSAVTASAAANYSLFQLYVDSVALTNGEKMGLNVPILVASVVGVNQKTHCLKWIIPSARAGTLVSLYGKKNSATTGNWVVDSDATGRTRLSYKIIA